MRPIYQVITKSGNPASREGNDEAIFLDEEKAQEHINFLIEDCGLDDMEFKIINLNEEPLNDILLMESIGIETKNLFNLKPIKGKEVTFETYYGNKTLLGLGRTVYQIINK